MVFLLGFAIACQAVHAASPALLNEAAAPSFGPVEVALPRGPLQTLLPVLAPIPPFMQSKDAAIRL